MKLQNFIRQLVKTKTFSIVLWCTGAVVVWRILLELVNRAVVPHVFHIQTGLSNWAAWDGAWYKGIVANGYFYTPGQQSSIAFFPFFPEATKSIAWLTHVNFLYVGLALNVILTVLASFFIYKLAGIFASKMGYKKTDLVGKLSVLLFLAFPSSLFLASFYVEAFLMVGILGTIYFALKGKLWVSAVFSAVAASSKSIGLIMPIILLLIDYSAHAKQFFDWSYLKKNILKYIALLLIGYSLFFCFVLYLKLKFHDALAFIHVEAAWQRNVGVNPVYALWTSFYSRTFQFAYFQGAYNYNIGLQAMYLPIVAFLGAVYFSIRYRFYWLIILALYVILLPISTGTINSMNRYVFCLAPLIPLLVVKLATLGKKGITITVIIILICLPLLVLSTTAFLSLTRFAG